MRKVSLLYVALVAVLVAALFLLDMVAGVPFRKASMLMDISLVICAILLGIISWMTLREQA